MVRKFITKLKRKNVGKVVTSLLIGVILIAGTVVPVSAATEGTVSESSVYLFTFWSDLLDWFADSVEYSTAAYYDPGTGLTFLGVLVVAILAAAVIMALLFLLYKLLRFGR